MAETLVNLGIEKPSTVDVPLTIANTETALTELNDIFDKYAFKFRAFVLTAKVSDDTSSSNDKSRPRNSDGLEIDSNITLTAVTDELAASLELYPKLRFKYLEQEAKLLYLRDVFDIENMEMGDVEAEEKYLKEYKTELRELKDEIRVLLEEIEGAVQRVTKGWEENQKNLSELEKLPQDLSELDRAIKEEMARFEGDDETMHLPLNETEALIRKLELEKSALGIEIRHLDNHVILGGKQQMEKLGKELGPMEMDYAELVGVVKQEKELREQVREKGQEDRNIEGRWNKAVIEGMKQMFDMVE
ncbi:hypothetical protein L211DRAFT_842555 [Terfezia boudieri ATCC MYA-4762]|uniref:Kinetochore protein Sos7 coiled-coil domain-containing protein n=1 Tax=Terfezia boudieri ATCC MYA-4762 TaxID=1051890 RepID=A0A3N4LCN2_9PEZI|nr:hypothetical protein L211DRAFT_842555 [Terfezia boudieri ATCC MYA-4762]